MAVDFGRDLSCTTSLKTGRYVTGARLVAEAAFRRLTTPRGMLRGGPDEEDYGLDLLELIGTVATKSDAAALGGRIQAELSKDERITRATVDVQRIVDGPAVSYEIGIDAETSEGPFTLKLGVDEVSVEILNLETEG